MINRGGESGCAWPPTWSWPWWFWPSTVMFVWKTWWFTITWPLVTWLDVKGGGGGKGGDGELNMGGGGMTPISVTAIERSGMSSMEALGSINPPPLCWEGSPGLPPPDRVMPAPEWLGVTLSFGSIDRGLTNFEPEIDKKSQIKYEPKRLKIGWYFLKCALWTKRCHWSFQRTN